ncbi:hypothetical protein ZWY2020_018627 [Hordeum vulgare]|nr:hypothetical protein ZWY2020_018627 [Hordeum vulgare]
MSSPSEKEQIVSAHPTDFTVTKLFTPKGPRFTFKKKSAGGEPMLEVESLRGFVNLRSHTFLDAASAQPVLHLQEVGLANRVWEAYRGNSTRESDKIFDAVNKSWCFPMGTNIEVFLHKSSDNPKPASVLLTDDDNSSDNQKPAGSVVLDASSSGKQPKAADFVVLGNYYRGELTVFRGCGCVRTGYGIAQIKRVNSLFTFKEQGGENTYDVRVNPGEDQAFVLALTVILDQMYYYDCALPASAQCRYIA